MLINQFEVFEGIMVINVIKVVLSYCVLFCVYLYGSLKVRDQRLNIRDVIDWIKKVLVLINIGVFCIVLCGQLVKRLG